MIHTTPLTESCQDILIKNMGYTNQSVYLLYDIESPLAQILSDAWVAVLVRMQNSEQDFSSSTDTGLCRNDKIQTREFKNPPQPLYRGGLINPDNPHLIEQNRIITAHNIEENKRVGLDHHETMKTHIDEVIVDPQIEEIKNELISLPS